MVLTSERLKLKFLGIELENPFILSAGPSTDDIEMARRGLDSGWAGLVLKTTSLRTTKVDLAHPMMSGVYSGESLLAMGNIDLISVHHIEDVLVRVSTLKKEFPSKMIAASIMSDSVEGWQALVTELRKAGVDLVECSFSCPQGSIGEDPGKMLAQSPTATEKVARWVKEAAKDTPVLVKITPQVTDVVAIARAVRKSGCEGVTASNSIPALTGVDVESFNPIPDVGGYSTYSGLSGPAIKPVTLRTVAEIAAHVPELVISGNGGISDWKDSVELLSVGAHNIQICTAVMLHGFDIIEDLATGLDSYLDRRGFGSVSETVGRALPKLLAHERLPRRKIRTFVVRDKCIGCGRCYVACRDGGHVAMVWDSEKRLPEVDRDRCEGCGLCLLTAPVKGCLEMKEVE
jgi:dihydropyrimidine dehydrogenase (NAD+) subunit PreA